jgi:hypothetical protein
VALTCTEPPHQATHWTGRAMAKTMGIALRSVQRIWQAHELQPHRIRTFKRSRDPSFAAKLTDIVGLYVRRYHGFRLERDKYRGCVSRNHVSGLWES